MFVHVSCSQPLTIQFNTFFTNIGPSLASQITTDGNKTYRSSLNEPSAHEFTFNKITEVEVLNIIDVHNNTPRYLSDRISTYAPPRTLRSGTQSLAAVPRINLERYGRRAFSCAGPSLWNALPLGLRTQKDPDHFRRELKTHLFNVFSK